MNTYKQQIQSYMPSGYIKAMLLSALLIVSFFWTAQIIAFIVEIGAPVIKSLSVPPIIITAVIGVFMYVLMTAIVFAAFKLVDSTITRKTLGVHKKIRWNDLLLALGVFPVYMITTAIVGYVSSKIMPWVDPSQAQDVSQITLSGPLDMVMGVLLIVVAAPFFEELLTRGLLFGKLRQYKINIIINIVIVSVLFGLAHMQWNVGIDTFVISIYMCMMRMMTGTIWAGMLLHMLKNGIAFILIFVVGLDNLVPTSMYFIP